MTGIYGASLLLIGLPLAGAIVLLVGGRLLDRIGHLIGCATVIAAFCVGVAVFATMLGEAARRPGAQRPDLHLDPVRDAGH